MSYIGNASTVLVHKILFVRISQANFPSLIKEKDAGAVIARSSTLAVDVLATLVISSLWAICVHYKSSLETTPVTKRVEVRESDRRRRAARANFANSRNFRVQKMPVVT